jgi:hypothetical protein
MVHSARGGFPETHDLTFLQAHAPHGDTLTIVRSSVAAHNCYGNDSGLGFDFVADTGAGAAVSKT